MSPRLRLPLFATALCIACFTATPRQSWAGRGSPTHGGQCFIENKGQWDSRALFLARSAGANVWITETGAVYDFKAISNGHVVRMEFEGGTPSSVVGEGEKPGTYSYFIGKDRSKWASGVRRFEEARTERVYEGIEARWYFDEGRPRYDLVVAPGADPRVIAMRFDGATGLRAQGRTLTLGTSLGAVSHAGLYAYQSIEGRTREVECGFRANGNVARFDVGDYDPTLPLVIDPIIWSTFLGGDGYDQANRVVLEADASVIMAGYTTSTDFPTSVGAYDLSLGGTYDTFVARLSPDAVTLECGVYYGGTGADLCWDVEVDGLGDIYIAGGTDSTNLPTTPGAFTYVPQGGLSDGFVAKIAADGTELLWSTYLGGSVDDYIYAMDLDSARNVVVGGSTTSTNFPTRPYAYDRTYNGAGDMFLSKLSSNGSSLVWSTFIGANLTQRVTCLTVAPDNKVVAGAVVHNASVQNEISILKMSADGTTLEWQKTTSALGGTGEPTAIALDPSGNVYVGGLALSTFPTTAGAHRTTFAVAEGFLMKTDPDGNTLYATFVGGSSSNDATQDVVADRSGSATIVGKTGSSDFLTTLGCQDPTFGGVTDAFVSKYSPDGSTLNYSTFLGDTGIEHAYGVALDKFGDPTVVGRTDSPAFPTTVGVFSTTKAASSDAYATRFVVPSPLYDFTSTKPNPIGGFSFPASVTLTSFAPVPAPITFSTSIPTKVFPPDPLEVSAGARTKTFPIKSYTVLVSTPFTVTASCGGLSKTLNFTLIPGGLKLLKVDPVSVVSGSSAVGTVALSAPAPAGGRTVFLTSSSPDLQVPASVLIPATKIQATFSVNATGSPQTAQLTARLGTVTKQIDVDITPP